MSNLYVRSTDGSNADNGTTWALAKATLVGVDAVDAAGDSIYVSQAHAESTAAAVTVAYAGTLTNPTRLICGNDAAEPPTAVALTGTVTSTGLGNGITIQGAGLYVYGLTFNAGTGGTSAGINLGVASCRHVYEKCKFILVNTGAAGSIRPGVNASTNHSIEWKSCDIKFAAVGQAVNIAGRFAWRGGTALSGGTSPTVIFSWLGNTLGSALIEDVDFSNFSAGVNLFNPPPTALSAIIRNCKLPGSWSGSVINGTFSAPGRIEMYNCAAGAVNYKLWIEDYYGSVKDETTLIRTGGGPISWKMVSSANAIYPIGGLASGEIVFYSTSTGVAKTVTVHVLRDSATNLKDDEIGVEVSYLGSSAAPLGTLITDFKADVLATAADQAASSETWTTSGMSNPNKQKLDVTFTPQMAGLYLIRVVLFKASTTLYVDPQAVIS